MNVVKDKIHNQERQNINKYVLLSTSWEQIQHHQGQEERNDVTKCACNYKAHLIQVKVAMANLVGQGLEHGINDLLKKLQMLKKIRLKLADSGA